MYSDFPASNNNDLNQAHNNKAMSVSELNRQVKKLLEASYNPVWVEGELSSFSRPNSGHWYFSLKDSKAQLRCAMFKGFNQRLKFLPKEGDKILVKGKLSLYEGRGDYQLIAESMEPAGLGQLQAAFEALKLKLSQEGLFDARRKKKLPKLPKKIGLITSETGAVVHDVITVCEKRFPLVPIVLMPVVVQGEHAAADIARTIARANELQVADVLIVGRGGGSLEDLWAFNEEVVARAIANSQIPIVSAVGHEVDVTIADWVADYRAPTPSAAAESVTIDQFDLIQTLDQHERRLSFVMHQQLTQQQKRLEMLSNQLKTPAELLIQKSERIQELYERLTQRCKLNIELKSQQLANLDIQPYKPEYLLNMMTSKLSGLKNRLDQQNANKLREARHELSLAAEKLNMVSPLATLSRGYAIAKTAEHKVIRDPEQLNSGDLITVHVEKGDFSCKVE